MTQEQRHDIAIARKELEFYSVLIEELNKIGNVDFETAKKELEFRGCAVVEGSDLELEQSKHKQVDFEGTYVGFTLICVCGELDINYGWVFDMSNTDLYKWKVGEFRPYYDEQSRLEYYGG